MADTTRPELLAEVKFFLGQTIRGRLDIDGAEAWQEFFDLYNRILGRFAIKLGFRLEDIDDLLQEVWLDVIRLLKTFEYDPARGGFRRWLYRIMRSKAADIGRKRQRQPIAGLGTEQTPLGWESLPDPNAADPVDLVNRKFLKEVVDLAVEKFRSQAMPDDWEIFDRCKLQGQTSTEAAQALGLTPEATRKRLQRSLAKFRDTLTALIGNIDPAEALLS